MEEQPIKPTWSLSEHKEITAKDCEAVAKMLNELAVQIREGNLEEFENFWMETDEESKSDYISGIQRARELIIIRYFFRKKNTKP